MLVSLPAFLLACLPGCMAVFLSGCMSACVFACSLRVCSTTRMFLCLHGRLCAGLPLCLICVVVYLSVCLLVCLFACLCLSVCLSVCLSISFIETQTVHYISNTKYKQCTEFSFSLMQTTLVVSIVYVLMFFSREDTCQLVEDDSLCLSVCMSLCLSVCLSCMCVVDNEFLFRCTMSSV